MPEFSQGMIETWVESDGWVCVDRWEDVKQAHTYSFDTLMANMEDDKDREDLGRMWPFDACISDRGTWHKLGKGYLGIEQARLRCSGVSRMGSLWPEEDHDYSTMMDTQENTGMYGLQSMKHSRKAYKDIDESVEWACLKRLKRLLHTLDLIR
ncbi:conserved hypothetical protein [Histoplasma capsulatum var. duboisii H88]|uniref:Uncharacterized protein n=2 Tax=Ajellomyces capsulatus TaxID=5037 RepID=F0UD40_AJEC8|nr:conserved hypothetical protein [Histoplasma capsulatum H143]EGC43466.1 conserved hypothetical protein [Histoplasma capsulatum var. duboisii H88]